jgi:hypothetical protein
VKFENSNDWRGKNMQTSLVGHATPQLLAFETAQTHQQQQQKLC